MAPSSTQPLFALCIIALCIASVSAFATAATEISELELAVTAVAAVLSAGLALTYTGSAKRVDRTITPKAATPEIQLITASELRASASGCPAAKKVLGSYVEGFLGKGHAELGRKGPVCPYVPQALKKDTLYFATVRGSDLATIEGAAKSFVQRFQTLEPSTGRMAAYRAVVLIFPDVPLEAAPELIDATQHKLKESFVSEGLMIGEFHALNKQAGLRSDTFFPLQTPHPALAIRQIVTTDIAFLKLDKYTPTVRVKFLESFLGRFPEVKSTADTKAVEEARSELERAREELRWQDHASKNSSD